VEVELVVTTECLSSAHVIGSLRHDTSTLPELLDLGFFCLWWLPSPLLDPFPAEGDAMNDYLTGRPLSNAAYEQSW